MDRLELWGWGVVAGVASAAHLPTTSWQIWGCLTLIGAGLGLLRSGRLGALWMGLCLGQLAVSQVTPGPTLEGWLSIEGIVTSPPVGSQVRLHCEQVRRVSLPSEHCTGPVEVRLPFGARAPAVGTRLVAVGDAGGPSHSVLPGEPDPVRQTRLSGVRSVVRARRWQALDPLAPRRDPLPGATHQGVLEALALGDRSAVPAEVTGLLRRTGTSHLLAISGFHVGLVAGIVGGLAHAVVRLAGIWVRGGLSPSLPWLVGAVAAWGYALGAGAPVSALRAAGMVSLAAGARIFGRRARPELVLALLAALAALVDPAVVTTPGYQLSFGAVVGLVRITPRLTRLLPPDLPRPVAWAASGAFTSIAATVGTLPSALWWFQQLAPVSVFANLVAVPWVGTVLAPLALICAWGPPWLGGLLLPLADGAATIWLWMLRCCDAAPLLVAATPLGAVFLVLPLIWPRPSWTWWTAVLALTLGTRPVGTTTVTFLDVGQGDAALVRHRSGETWLVDGGPRAGAVTRWLLRQHLRSLDVVASSHGHPDHTRGLGSVLETVRVDSLWLPDAEGNEALVEAARQRGTRVVRSPIWALSRREDPTRGLNDRSLVLEVDGVLFAGDIEADAEAVLAGRLPRARVLKVPHHGSDTSSTQALLDAVRPELAVISVGEGNRYGHPADTVLERYRASGTAVCRTDRHGTVEVRLGERLTVRTWWAGRGWSPWLPPEEACPEERYSSADSPSTASGSGAGASVSQRKE